MKIIILNFWCFGLHYWTFCFLSHETKLEAELQDFAYCIPPIEWVWNPQEQTKITME